VANEPYHTLSYSLLPHVNQPLRLNENNIEGKGRIG
jgi:hypothetical protein